jgi:hypothetical protein
MKIILFLSFFILPSLSFAQTINTIPLKELDTEYLEMIPYRKPFVGSKIFMLIDFGQMIENVARPESRRVKDENGKDMVFNSDMDCLNFMLKYGYELVLKTEKISDGDSYSSYLMRRVKKNNSESKSKID